MTVALLALWSAAALAAQKVLNTPRSDHSGTADQSYFAYTQTRRGHPNAADVYLKAPGAARITGNSPRSTSFYANHRHR